MSICASKDPSFQAIFNGKPVFSKWWSQIGAEKLGNFVIFLHFNALRSHVWIFFTNCLLLRIKLCKADFLNPYRHIWKKLKNHL